jgi:hypothetical protein
VLRPDSRLRDAGQKCRKGATPGIEIYDGGAYAFTVAVWACKESEGMYLPDRVILEKLRWQRASADRVLQISSPRVIRQCRFKSDDADDFEDGEPRKGAERPEKAEEAIEAALE